MIVRRRPVGRRRGTTLAAGRPTRARRAGADAAGCASPPGRWYGRSQTRRAAAPAWDRRRTCTTGLLAGLACLPPGLAGLRRATPRTNGARGPARSRREAVTALVTTGLEDRPAGAGAHPCPKAMLLRPAAVVRLERALHAASLRCASRQRCWYKIVAA